MCGDLWRWGSDWIDVVHMRISFAEQSFRPRCAQGSGCRRWRAVRHKDKRTHCPHNSTANSCHAMSICLQLSQRGELEAFYSKAEFSLSLELGFSSRKPSCLSLHCFPRHPPQLPHIQHPNVRCINSTICSYIFRHHRARDKGSDPRTVVR